MNVEANALFTKVFFNLISRRTEVRTFRKVVDLGLPHAAARLADDNMRAAGAFLADPSHDKFFLDKDGFIGVVGGAEGLAKKVTSRELDVFRLSVDAASLVFMHSALDGAVQDCCRICALVAPGDWEQFLKNRKVSLEDLKGSDYQTIFRARLSEHLEDLERESLFTRIDRLFALCKPPKDFVGVKGFSFDGDRLRTLDNDRHAIIHGDGVAPQSVGDAIDFLHNTGLFLVTLVNHRYDVKVDPEWVREHADQIRGWGKLNE